MNDTLLVRGFERVGDLGGDPDRLLEAQRTVCDAVAQRVAVHQLQNERTPEPAEAGPHDRGVFEAIDRRDVWMVQRCEQLRLTLEPDEAVGISGEQCRQDLQGDVAVKPRLSRG